MRLNVLFTTLLSAAAAAAAATAHGKRDDITVDLAVVQEAATAFRQSVDILGSLQAYTSSVLETVPTQARNGLLEAVNRANDEAANLIKVWDQLAGDLEGSATDFQDMEQGAIDMFDVVSR